MTTTKSRIAPGVLSTTLDDSITIYHPSTESYYTLEGTSAFIWQLLERGADDATIVADLSRRYEVDGAQAQLDLHRFLEELSAANVLAVESDEAAAADGD